MTLNYAQGMAIPRPNPSYPLARLGNSTYAPPLSYNQPTEVINGYDAKINPMTGQEIPDANFAGGGLASLLESKGRRGDTMLVHMHPEEVRGLQALAMAHGGSLTINPETGLYEASFLKKLLPTIIGAILPSVPGIGSFAKTIGFGSEALGTGLLVGGVTGLIEGDLKKGLQAGLGAYSGANIAQSLRAASIAGESPKLSPEQVTELRQANAAENATRNLVGATDIAPLQAMPVDKNLQASSLISTPTVPRATTPFDVQIARRMPSMDVTAAPVMAGAAPTPSIMGGIKALATPEGRGAFGQALGGVSKSPFMQNIAKTATFSGLMGAFEPEPVKFPGAGGGGDDYVYIPGGFNPLYGTSRDQPYQLPGKYYRRTPQGLVPFNPFAMAPGYADGGEVEGYADGGIVDPNMDPGGSVMTSPQFRPYFTNPVTDPNVAATRSYIEELNRRAMNPVVTTYPGGAGLGGVNQPYVPGPRGPGGGGGGGGDGSLTGSPIGDFAASMVAQHYINKGIGAGVGYLKEKFFPTEEQQLQQDLDAEQAQRDALEAELQKDVAAEPPLNLSAFSALPAAVSPFAPAPNPLKFSVDVQTGVDASGEPIWEKPGEPPVTQPSAPSSVASLAPAAISAAPAVANSIASLASAGASRGAGAANEVVVNASRKAAWNAAYDKALAAAKENGLVGEAASEAAGKAADASTSGIAGTLKNWAFKDPSAGFSGGLGNLRAGFEAPSSALGKAAAVVGAYNTFKSIEAGKEGRAAFDAFMTASQFGGPLTGLAAAAIAAIGASLVNTKEYGDKALSNYWKAVDQGRGFGSAPPEELAQGFINFYRTNKNNFAGQERYGRTGNEDFVYDMTQVINDAVKSGKVDKGVDAATMYQKVVQPWLNSMGSGPQNEDARRIQDFMMTDLIHNFMYGQPISNAQVKGDNKYKIVSERPVYAGAPPEINKYSLYNVATTAPELTYGGSRISSNVTPEDSGPGAAYRAAQLQQTAGPTMRAQPVTQREMTDTAPPTPAPVLPEPVNPYSTPLTEEMKTQPFTNWNRSSDGTFIGSGSTNEPVAPPREPAPYVPPDALTDLSIPRNISPIKEEEERVYIPRPQVEEAPVYEAPVYERPAYIPRRREMEFMSPFAELGEGREYALAGGGAIGEDYNFGFAGGGMPEYQAGGTLLNGPGDGMSDDIPAVIRGKGVQRAALADGEFVIPADVVSHLGNGSTKAGAQKLYDMMDKVRQARTGRTKQAPAVKADRFLPV